MDKELPFHLQFVVYLLVPALSALLGAWAGADVALSRFKKERSFDRRLDWLESTARTIAELRTAKSELYEDAELKNFQAMFETLPRVLEHQRKLLIALYDAELYAPEDSVQTAIDLRVKMMNLKYTKSTETDNEKSIVSEIAMVKEMSGKFDFLTNKLQTGIAAEVRRELIIEPKGWFRRLLGR